MMEQLKNERLRMREQNHFLDLLINASPMGVVITSLDGEVSQMNPMALKMLGIRMEEAMGNKLIEIDSPLAVELAAIAPYLLLLPQRKHKLQTSALIVLGRDTSSMNEYCILYDCQSQSGSSQLA